MPLFFGGGGWKRNFRHLYVHWQWRPPCFIRQGETTAILYLQVVYTGRAAAPPCHRISLKVVHCVYLCVPVCAWCGKSIHSNSQVCWPESWFSEPVSGGVVEVYSVSTGGVCQRSGDAFKFLPPVARSRLFSSLSVNQWKRSESTSLTFLHMLTSSRQVRKESPTLSSEPVSRGVTKGTFNGFTTQYIRDTAKWSVSIFILGLLR